MILQLEKSDLHAYLTSSPVIDYDNENVRQCAQRFVGNRKDEITKIKTVYEFVRDKIPHTFDIQGQIVTCRASEVLKAGQGICFAKSHLLAALLRSVGIPTGFCYQKLILSEEMPKLVLHGLNAVYLKSLDRWIRLDARGNKPGVDAQFSLEQERLAFPVHRELGEVDGFKVYAEPGVNVIEALEKSVNVETLVVNLPTEI